MGEILGKTRQPAWALLPLTTHCVASERAHFRNLDFPFTCDRRWGRGRTVASEGPVGAPQLPGEALGGVPVLAPARATVHKAAAGRGPDTP